MNWTAPASDGGSAITSYRVTPYIGTTAQTADRHGSRTGDLDKRHRADQRHRLHLQSRRHERGRHRGRLVRVQLGDAAAPAGPGRADRRDRDRRHGSATGDLDRAGQRRWQPDHQLHGDARTSGRPPRPPNTVTGPTGDPTTVTGLTNGTAYTFKVSRHQRGRHRAASAASNAVTPTAARRRPARRPASPRPPVTRSAPVSWTAPARRRQRDHQLHGHPLHRDHRTDADDRDRQPTGHPHHRHRADQRHRLHLHRHRHQRHRHRAGLRRLQRVTPTGARPRRPPTAVTATRRRRAGAGDAGPRRRRRRQRDHQLHGHAVTSAPPRRHR